MQIIHGLLYLTRLNEIFGYHFEYDHVKAMRNANGDIFNGMNLRVIHCYPLGGGSLSSHLRS